MCVTTFLSGLSQFIAANFEICCFGADSFSSSSWTSGIFFFNDWLLRVSLQKIMAVCGFWKYLSFQHVICFNIYISIQKFYIWLWWFEIKLDRMMTLSKGFDEGSKFLMGTDPYSENIVDKPEVQGTFACEYWIDVVCFKCSHRNIVILWRTNRAYWTSKNLQVVFIVKLKVVPC